MNPKANVAKRGDATRSRVKRHRGKEKQGKPKPLMVSVDDVSEVTGIPRRTLYVMARKMLIPCYRTGGEQVAVRFIISEVVDALRQPALTPPPTGEAAKG